MARGTPISGGEAASEREWFHRPVRECRPALRYGGGDPVRPHILAEGGGLLFPHRAVRRRQDVVAQAALFGAAAEPWRHPPVWRGHRHHAASSPSRLSPPH